MKDYCQPTLRDVNPSNIIIHVRTHDLNLDKTADEIAENIVDLEKSIKTKKNKIIISKLVPRADKLNDKANDVNKKLEEICKNDSIDIMDNSNINIKRHINKNKLHLTDSGVSVIARNFKDYLMEIDQQFATNETHVSSYLSLEDTENNDFLNIKQQRLSKPNNIILGHLNINSVRNKFFALSEIIKNFDIFLISETKLDQSFPNKQFELFSYKTFRRERNSFGGGLMFYVKDYIPCKQLIAHNNISDSEIMVLEVHD